MDDGRLNIADLGSSQFCAPCYDIINLLINEIGTIYERDVILTIDRVLHESYLSVYSFEVDVWSMVTVLLEIMTGIKPFYVPLSLINTCQEYSYILNRINQVLDMTDPLKCVENSNYRKLIGQMLTYNRNERITSEQALISLSSYGNEINVCF
jgi:serine/threonine protein kinase